MDIKVERFINSIFSSNTYVVHDLEKAVVVDLGDVSRVAGYIRANGLKLKAMLLTHTHYDHIYGIRGFMNEFPGVPVYTSGFGREALANPKWNFSRYHNDPIAVESPLIRELADGERLPMFVDAGIEVIATPGHDKSCLTYKIGNRLFTGDSFIPGVKVIATFPKSDKTEAQKWYQKLQQMSVGINTFPGHGCVILDNGIVI